MFAVIYRFNVHPGKEVEFEDAWEHLTKLILEYEGSLGSRLHRNENGEYIAYAQWPDRETWLNAGSNLPAAAEGYRKNMRESCQSIETLHELDPINDLLEFN